MQEDNRNTNVYAMPDFANENPGVAVFHKKKVAVMTSGSGRPAKISFTRSVQYTSDLPHIRTSSHDHRNQQAIPNHSYEEPTNPAAASKSPIAKMNEINDRYIFQTVYQRDYCGPKPPIKCRADEGYVSRKGEPAAKPEPGLRMLKWPQPLQDINDYVCIP